MGTEFVAARRYIELNSFERHQRSDKGVCSEKANDYWIIG